MYMQASTRDDDDVWLSLTVILQGLEGLEQWNKVKQGHLRLRHNVRFFSEQYWRLLHYEPNC